MVRFQMSTNHCRAIVIQVFPKNAPNDLCFFGNNHQHIRFLSPVKPHKGFRIEIPLPLLHFILNPHPHILGNALAFLLCNARHDGDQNFALGIQRIDGFFFKVNGNSQLFQFSNILETIQRISGKSTDGFGDNHVDFSCLTVLNHLIELISVFCAGSAYPFICVNTCQFPSRIIFNIFYFISIGNSCTHSSLLLKDSVKIRPQSK